MDNPEKPAT